MKKKHPEHVNLERWLVSYADFITLLFAFFVVMYAISQADLAKFNKVAGGIRAAFSGDSAFDLSGKADGNAIDVFSAPNSSRGSVIDLPAGKTNATGDSETQLQEVRDLLQETVSLDMGAADTSDHLQMKFDSRGLIVQISAKNLFEEGEYEPQLDYRPLLDRIGKIVYNTKALIRIEGHTDLVEMKDGKELDGWDLSFARAAWIGKYWIEKYKIDPKRIGMSGYSHYRLLDDKQRKESKNKRIELIFLNNQYQTP